MPGTEPTQRRAAETGVVRKGPPRFLVFAAIFLVVVVALAWSILALPLFSEFRRGIVEQALEPQIGQPLTITGDARVLLGPVSTVRAEGVQIPSENIDNLNLVELATLEFDVDLIDLIGWKINIDNLLVDGLKVELLTREDGTHSWSDADQDAISTRAPNQNTQQFTTGDQGLLGFLRTRTAQFSNIRVFSSNEKSGLEFEFRLEDLSLAQLDNGTTLRVDSHGAVNGQPFVLEGTYPKGQPFETSAQFSSIDLSFDGNAIPLDEGGGFTAQLTLDVAGMGDLLEVLKLNRTFEGDGLLTSTVTASEGVLSLADFSTKIDLEGGETISVQGDVGNLADVEGVEIEIDARLHPEGAPPPDARQLKDLKLTGLSTRIISVDGQLVFEDLLAKTNAFEQGLNEVGPASIRRIRRMDTGELAFEDIYVQSGPIDDPILVARGSVRNVLQGEKIDLEGSINAPASLLLGELGEEVADAFGAVQAEFAVNDAQGFLSISRLSARAVDTEVWALDADLKVGDVTTLDGFAFDYAIEVQDGADFFAALKLNEIDTGPLGLGMSVRGEDGFWNGDLRLGAGQSELSATVSNEKVDGRTRINATIFSDRMEIRDLRNSVDGAIEISRIGSQDNRSDTPSTVELQPLVLPKDEEPEQARPAVNEAGVELQPLVLSDEPELEVFDPKRFLRDTDIFAKIDFKRIAGIQGVSSVSSEFVSLGGKAKLGPLQFNYGGGNFNFGVEIDAVDAPDILRINGTTSGWNLKDIARETGMGIDVSGELTGSFDLRGRTSSIDSFVSSLTGKTTVQMENGQLGTSLLELAGLGIFPWLFSSELNQGYTNLACVNAPLRFAAGVMSFDAAVVETQSVQLVARGTVDLKNEVLAIRAEPRPIGRPLARSAFPFDVSGSFADPRFELDWNGKRRRRSDGADQMPTNREPCRPDIVQLEQSGG